MPANGIDPVYRQINDAIVRAGQVLSGDPRPSPQRRRVPRQSISWFGRYRLGDSPEWGQCEVIDVSVVGVGALIAAHSATDLLNAWRITMQVHSATGASIRLELSGAIRHAVPTPAGPIRVGVEFVGLSDTEQAILDALEHMGIGW